MNPAQQGVTVDLFFRTLDLKEIHMIRSSDPYVRVDCLEFGSTREVGRTEVSKSLTHSYLQPVRMEYMFQAPQELNLVIMDENLAFDDEIGSAKVSLARIINNNGPLLLPLFRKGTKQVGNIEVRAEKVATPSNRSIVFNIIGEKLNASGFFSVTSPMLRILRATGNENPNLNPVQYADNSWTLAYQSEPHTCEESPKFEEFAVNLEDLCRSNPNLPLKFQIWDHSLRGKHTLVSQGITSMANILSGNREVLMNEQDGTRVGKLVIVNVQEMQNFDIVDYLRMGLNIQVTFGLDFGPANGNPTSSSSYHYLNPQGYPNDFEIAIQNVGQVMSEYSRDGTFSIFGVGIEINGKKDAMYPLSADNPMGQVRGTQGALSAYKYALQQGAETSMQNNFAPIIKMVGQQAASCPGANPMKYHVLVMLTDGTIGDMDETRDAVVSCSSLPMSIIIVGIGKKDITNWFFLRELDGDKGELADSKGKRPLRDIVHFFPLEEYKQNPIGMAKAVLAELPTQINRYYSKMGIYPR